MASDAMTSAAPGPALRGRLGPVLWAGLVLALVVYTVSTIPGVRPEPGFDALLDGWLKCVASAVMAILCLLRPGTSPRHRLVWNLVGAALALRALAFIAYTGFVRELDPIPYPSVADAGWLGMDVLLLLALVVLARAHFTKVARSLLLDGLVGALATSAVAVAVLYPSLEALTAPGTPRGALLVNLAYPIADVLLLLMLLGVLVAHRWRPPAAVWLLSAGVAGYAAADSIFVYQVAAGTFRPGEPLSALLLIATALIAAAAWTPDRRPSERLRALPGLVLPGLFALSCLGLLVFAALATVPLGAVLLATAGLVVAIGRTALSFRDVRAVAEARREARTDELTGVANRRAFNETAGAMLRGRDADRPLALLVLDLDGFKDVNDDLGHHRGDELLALVAPRLELALRSGDLLARIGGDEFGVVLEGAGAELAGQVAERLQSGFRRPFTLAGRELVAGASIGIARFPDDGLELEDLLRHADAAMYEAKDTHTGYGFFRPERHQSNRERLSTVARLRQALEADELVVHYQPQVALDTGAVVGVEALVRWQHPESGLLGPGSFLPQAESGGLMRLLTLNVLEQAIRQCAAWRAQGNEVTVSANLSVTNLLDTEFPDQLAMLLEGFGVPGEALVLELTEDLFMADPARGERVIAALREAGVAIVVDDYGTGYSSLGYLRDLREIRGLKLDRSFVTHLDTDPRARAIVESTVALARALGLGLVAEGVETAAVRDELAALGCELAQGFLFARPAPAAQLDFGVIDLARAVRE